MDLCFSGSWGEEAAYTTDLAQLKTGGLKDSSNMEGKGQHVIEDDA